MPAIAKAVVTAIIRGGTPPELNIALDFPKTAIPTGRGEKLL